MRNTNDNGLPFMKMHGLGNDFVVVDARAREIELTSTIVQALGDRHRGVGFDQLAVMKERSGELHLTFFNADGSTAGACGNATRCIARHVMNETGSEALCLTTERGVLMARDVGDGMTSVNMGTPQLDWVDIPLATNVDTLHLPIEGEPTATGMGNPHCTFFVEDLKTVNVPEIGADHEHHPLFPERTNVQFVQVIGPDHLRVKVWERGVGVTLASGSSSCAVAVAAARRKLTSRAVRIDLDGGTLFIDWKKDGVWMKGPTRHVFSASLTQEFLDGLL